MEPVSASGTSLAELQRSSSAWSSSSGTAGWIVGRLQLCNFHQMAASLGQCLALSDASATICCLIPCFHCGLLDKTVRVTAWNYVPGFYLGESRGLLEVLCLDPVGTSSLSYAEQTFPSLCVNPGTADARDNILESPLMKVGKKKSVRLVIQGQLMCISPPFSLPQGKRAEEDRVKVEAEAVQGSCQSKQLNLNRLGFLVELVICRHKPICRCLHHEQENSLMAGTGNTGVSHVYFSQGVACWQPVLSSEFGQCIAITGLRRKSLRVEGGNRCFYVATRTTLVLPATIKSPYGRWQSESPRIMPGALGPRFKSAEMPSTAGKLQCGGWRKKPKGIEPNVSGGCLEQCPVDVDNSDELTSYQGTVTAIFEQNLLVEMDKSVFILLTHVQDLGIATLRAGMTLRAHNVHKVVIRNHWRSCVLLGACSRSHVVVEKFSAVSNPCFIHQPCQNALSKYLGHLTFASAFWILLLTASFSLKFDGAISHEELVGTKKRPGLIQQYLCTWFTVIPTVRRNAVNEFLDHEQCCTFSDVLPTNFGLQVPPISNLLTHMGLLWNDTSSVLWHMRVVTSNLANEVVGTEGRCLRRTISGSELGVILLGCLQVSKTSGKLQLVDGTGAIDVVVPDFHSICSLCKVYEVSQYILVLEGPRSGEFDETGVGGEDRLPLSSSNILKKKVYGKPSLGSLRIFLYFRLQEATHVRQLPCPVRSPEPKDSLQLLKQILLTDRHLNSEVLMVTYKHPLKVRASSWGGQAELRTFIAEAIILPCSITLQGGKQDLGFAPNTSMMADNKLPTAAEYEHGFKDLSRKHLQGFEASVCFPTCSQQEGKECETSAVRFEMLDIRRVHNGLPMESSGEMHLSKVLLEFSSDTVEFYSLLRVGECYLLQFNHRFNNLQRHGARTSKVSVGVGMHLWSLHIALQDRQEPLAMQHVADDPNAEKEQVLADTKSKLGLQFESVSNWMEVDVVVHLPREGVDAFRKLVWHQQAQIVPPVLSLRDALPQSHISLSTDPREAEVRRTRLVSSHCLPASNRSFVGELVSLTGRVEKVSLQGCFKDGLASNKSQATASLRRQCVDIEVEVTDLAGPERVKVLLTFIPDTLPVGLGQGAIVTFHRIVPYTALPDFTVCCRSSAATSVVVHTIPQVPFGCVEEGLGLSAYDGGSDITRLVSTLKRMGPDYVVRGRVVRVRRVIFRWQGDACSRRDMRPNIMGSSSISTSAHFTIDDGTRNIACWAAGQAATSLLGLAGAGGQLQLRGPLLEPQKDVWCRPAGSLGMEVASMVQKHEQIFIQNNSWDGCEADAGASCLSINGAGSYPPGVDEQALLKSLVLQACNNRQWDLLCEVRVSKRKTFQPNANTQRHYLYVLSVKPVEYIRDLKNKCDRLFSLLTE